MRGPAPASFVFMLLLIVPAVGAQPAVPGIEDAVTDGTAFEFDAPATVGRVRAVADVITGQGVHDCVRDVTSDAGTAYRLMGSPTQGAFVDRNKDVFAELGLPSALHHFQNGSAGLGPARTGAVLGEGGTNIVGVLPGADPAKWVVVGGHYDTREGTIGALDNGSGICTVYEIARALKADADANGPLAASVVFVWYDGEEWGLYGATAFAQDPSVAKELLGLDADAPVDVLVSQSFDMPGINYPARNLWVQYGEPVDTEAYAVLNLRTAPIHADEEWTCWSYGCYEDLKLRDDFDRVLHANTNYQFLVREVAYDLLQYPPDYVWVYDDHYGRSDHIPLIAQGAAGMRIQGSHDEEYPCYHQPCDTLEWLHVQTGSEAELVRAYDAEATVGGTTAYYAALVGEVGPYGEPYWAEQRGLDLVPLLLEHANAVVPLDAGEPVLDADAPGPAPLLVLAALVAVAAVLRRRP